MDNNKKTRSLNQINKYEQKIVLVAFIPAGIILGMVLAALLLARQDVVSNVMHGRHVNYAAALLTWVYQWSNSLLLGLCFIFLFSVWIAFRLARCLVGAFTRIIPELDAVLEGRRQKPLKVRPGDELAEELLKRVNVLVQFYVDNKK